MVVTSDSAGDEVATGTGFYISEDGMLITNLHVIENSDSAVAKLADGRVLPVLGVLADGYTTSDLVLLKTKGNDLPALKLGNVSKIEIGQRIAVVGSPLGLEGSVSDGVVSGLRNVEGNKNWIQITAAISPGSSGSPVLNLDCEVVGIATMMIQGGQSLNFAIPVEAVSSLTEQAKRRKWIISPIKDAAESATLRDLTDTEYVGAEKARESGNYKEAETLLETFLIRHPNNEQGYSDLGDVYLRLEKTQAALKVLKTGSSFKPG